MVFFSYYEVLLVFVVILRWLHNYVRQLVFGILNFIRPTLEELEPRSLTLAPVLEWGRLLAPSTTCTLPKGVCLADMHRSRRLLRAFSGSLLSLTPGAAKIQPLIGRGLKLKWRLENDFRSSNLGTNFSQLFHAAKDPNNAVLKVFR